MMEDSNIHFRYVRLYDLDFLKEKWLNSLQAVETWSDEVSRLQWVKSLNLNRLTVNKSWLQLKHVLTFQRKLSPKEITGMKWQELYITKTRLFKYIENFTTKKNSESFQIKILIFFFYISAKNIDCGYLLEPPRRGGSNEYPQSMFLSRNKKDNIYPCKPQFYYTKVGFKRVKII